MTAPTNAPETLNVTDALALFGGGRTRFYQLRKLLGVQRIPTSNEHRPFYRREDILAMKYAAPPESGLIEGSPEWIAEMHRRAKEAAEAGGEPGL